MLLPGGANRDLNVLAKGCQEFHEATHGEATSTISHQQGNLRLLHAENFGDLGLRHAAALEDRMDLQSELRFKQFLFRVGKAQVRKDVLTALRNAASAAARSLGFCFHARFAFLCGLVRLLPAVS